MAFVIDAELDIAAPAELVWQVITDFPRYAEWNPFVTGCESSLKPGDPIDLQVRVFSDKPQAQREWIRTHTPGREFSYSMKPVPLGTLHSARSHTVIPLGPGRCRYRSHFELAGWLQPLVRGLLGASLRRGFAGMTEGIKTRAERLWKEQQG
ncbi:MAG: SRPBCC domain-containing protein [Nevskia sp.]|nr:SRPBCC domain-containing protein [Nevskia sp.]